MTIDKTAIRDAATIIIVRENTVLMGQRGSSAAFMPNKFVFPGGAIDPADETVPSAPLAAEVAEQMAMESTRSPHAIAAAAIRELWEESGLCLGAKHDWADPPQGWRSFAATGHVPNAAALQFFFRAVTPTGRPRRFDARFMLATADALVTDPDDFSRAEEELSHLQWIPIEEARNFDLPFITQVVLAELRAHLANPAPLRDIPFYRHNDESSHFARLNGASVL